MPTNTAAWLTTHGQPLEIKSAPYTSPSSHQLTIRTHAVAINPVDWLTQAKGDIAFPWLTMPYIPGSDVSGTVVETGADVQHFKIGDRVLGHALNFQHNSATEGAFQQHVVLTDTMTAKIPENVKFEEAAVLPLALSTAAAGLFQEDYLGLDVPSFEGKKNGKTVLITGGSTSVGCNAVQLASLAGYEVISTSSPKNFELVKKLGSMEVFDYNSPTLVEDVVKALEGKTLAGAYAIGAMASANNGTAVGEACLKIVQRCKGKKFVAMAMIGPAEKAPDGIEAKFVMSTELSGNEVGKMIYGDFLPKALAEEKFLCAPEAVIVGHGLEKIQEALGRVIKGVSAQKLVVTL